MKCARCSIPLIPNKGYVQMYCSKECMLKEKSKRYRTTYKESRDKAYKKWRESHKDQEKVRCREWKRNNKSKVSDQRKKYNASHPEMIRHHAKTAKVKRRLILSCLPLVGRVSLEEWVFLLSYWKHQCAYCGMKGYLTQDHIVPLSKGGSHTMDNIVPACISCNCSKGSKSLEDFLK